MNTEEAHGRLSRPKVGHVVAAILSVSGIGYLMFSSQIAATREFNHGVEAYENERFDAAVSYFSRSVELSHNPTAVYNLALAHWAVVKAVGEAGNEGSVSQEQVVQKTEAARKAIDDALSNKELDEERILDLIYLDARILAVEGKAEEAKARLREALSLKESFKPALRELVRLDATEKLDPMRELLVTLADDEEPELIADYGLR